MEPYLIVFISTKSLSWLKRRISELLEDAENGLSDRFRRKIPGFGPIVASVFFGHVGNGEGFHLGKDVAVSLGLVPRQHSSGGKEVLLGISKRGDVYLRSLLVHGARPVVGQASKKEDCLSQWIQRLVERGGHNKAVVALANKMARMGWAILAYKTTYRLVGRQ